MKLSKFYELISKVANPFRVMGKYNQEYQVVCDGKTISGVQVDHEKGQIILKTYKRKEDKKNA